MLKRGCGRPKVLRASCSPRPKPFKKACGSPHTIFHLSVENWPFHTFSVGDSREPSQPA
ncbi:hypothetical protein ZIOFF_058515 [Zingiber officinale]|uniref:Uncharacterized protein n=1 Tax=Zingiber officinale TaxID=94328 RepID=A0A8J5KJD0_ZINOF|nr:hypothetical protein ZIOFF_058515 [Zingiber officinale]